MMGAEVADDRRRTPRQRRSRATHDAIVEAAARVFAEVGLEKATTARIAEVAGVSPGSMYQYFPSKDALVTALFERDSTAQHKKLLELASEMGTEDVRALVRAFVAYSIGEHERHRPLYRVLLHEVPKVSGLGPTIAIDRAAARSLRLLFEVGKGRVMAHDLDAAAILFVRAFRYCAMGVIDEPFADDAARERFVDELADMLTLYLVAPRPWRDV
jgi:AcrR family transcriptional regulator